MKRISALVLFLLFFSCSLPAQGALDKGEIALDFRLKDLKENTIALSSYRGRQPVFLFFWTTWCPYCARGLKGLNDIYPQLKEKGWEVLAINSGEPREKVAAFVRHYPLGFKVLLDENIAVAELYNVLGVPTYVLIDKSGTVVFKDNYFPADKINEFTPQ